MKKTVIVLIGCVPVIIGLVMQSFMAHTTIGIPYILSSIVFLVFWFVLGILLTKSPISGKITIAFANLPAFLCLILVIFQEIVLKEYFRNPIGLIT